MHLPRALAVSALCVAACSRSELLDDAPASAVAVADGGSGEASCAASGGTVCAGACVDLRSDDANCGACGHACEPGGGCIGGVCADAACPGGFELCDQRCVDLAHDPANCGACGARCPSWDGCAQGACVPVCPFVASRFTASSNPRFEPDRIAAADLDGDGAPDLAVAGFYGTSDQRTLGEVDLLFNQGGGVFAGPAATTLPLPENVCGLAAAPFAASGSNDLAACAYDWPVEIFRNEGTGQFASGAGLPAAPGPLAMVAADFDGDGRPDLAVVEQDMTETGGPGPALVTYLNQGAGVFAPVSLVEDPAAPLAATLLAGDVNGDGHTDLVGLPDTPELRVYLARGDGSFSALPGAALPQSARNGALGDVDGDGRADLVLALSDGSAQLYLGDGAGGFAAGDTLPAGAQSMGVVLADFDRDGRQDVAVADYDSDALAVFPGLGGRRFGAPALCVTGFSAEGLATADLDGDGNADLVTVDYLGQVAVLLYRGGRP